MDDFLTANQQVMKTVINDVNHYDKGLRSLSNWWEKIALIGKINSFEVASTILQDMDNTLSQFNELQDSLIQSLTDEHTRKIIQKNSSRCHMAIDVLIRNLFERTADIGFLSTDYDVIDFFRNLHNRILDKSLIEKRLNAYINIYSVYQDALLLTPDGNLVFQLSKPKRKGMMESDLIARAVNNPNEYVEYFGKTQLIGDTDNHLLYANAVVENDTVIGVIVLCFRFKNELDSITDRLLSEGEKNNFMLLNGAGKVLFAPEYEPIEIAPRLDLKTSPDIVPFANSDMVKTHAKGQPYQEYCGPQGWHVAYALPLNHIKWDDSNIREKETTDNNSSVDIKEISGLISQYLLNIRSQSISINDDLQLIVLNGIITAARNKSVEFMPVLEAIKKIGLDIDNIFDHSIESLFSTIISGQLETIQLQANLAVDIMDRNLYERANDCRWWALSSVLRNALEKRDSEKIHKVLADINALYTVYHTLYIYDAQGRYVAFSDGQYNDKIGTTVDETTGIKAIFQLNTEYEYCVSEFKPFELYQGENTYIYNAAIRDVDNHQSIIGGIGIVFDSTVEFEAILNDVLPRENNQIIEGSKALFTTDTGLVLASTTEEYAIGSHFLPPINALELEEKNSTAILTKIDGCTYLLGAAKSTGYREYKRDDSYQNNVISWVLTPVD